jgi:hypothetical protein
MWIVPPALLLWFWPGPRSPVPAGSPGRRLKDHTAAVLHRDVHMTAEVRVQRSCAVRVINQNEGRELRQVEPPVEYEVGFDPRVRQEHRAAQLRQCVAIHVLHPLPGPLEQHSLRAPVKDLRSRARWLAAVRGSVSPRDVADSYQINGLPGAGTSG